MQANTSISPCRAQWAPASGGERSELGACRSINKVDVSGSASLAAALAMTARAGLRGVKLADRPRRLVRVTGAYGRSSKARRYAVTVSSGSQHLVIDTALARVERARRRMGAWSAVVPKEIATVKRKREVIETPRLALLTLTYANGGDWRPNDIRDYMLALRAVLKARLIAYAWVLEMQERGAPHYHVMVYVRRGTRIPTPDKSGMWAKGMTNIETVKEAGYIMRYAGKEYQKEMLPGGARMFAVWISSKIVAAEALLLFRMSSLPKWFRDIVAAHIAAAGPESGRLWGRAPGGGWLLRPTGEIHPSPWTVIAIEELHGLALYAS